LTLLSLSEAALFGVALAAIGFYMAGARGIGGAFALVLVVACIVMLADRAWP
jgi:hypothetical protein